MGENRSTNVTTCCMGDLSKWERRIERTEEIVFSVCLTPSPSAFSPSPSLPSPLQYILSLFLYLILSLPPLSLYLTVLFQSPNCLFIYHVPNANLFKCCTFRNCNINICLSIYVCAYVCMYACMYICMYVSVNLSIYLLIRLSTYSPIRLFITFPSTHLSKYLSI